MISLVQLLDKYGYLAVFLGTFLEGETVLVLGGFAAHQGYLEFPFVVLAAFAGSLAGDQLAFLLGRRYGARLVNARPRLKAGITRATSLLQRHQVPLLVGFRFLYGVRNITPIAAGMIGIPIARFVLLNVLGAALWAASVSTAGYAFGRGFVLMLDRARYFEEHAMLAVVVLGALAFFVHRVRSRQHERRNENDTRIGTEEPKPSRAIERGEEDSSLPRSERE